MTPLRLFHFVLRVALVLALLAGTALFSGLAGVRARPLMTAPMATLSLVEDINPGAADLSTAGIVQIGNMLYISLNDGSHGYELWKSDGTAAGTDIVLDIRPGAPDAGPYNLAVVNNRVFFQADDGSHGLEPWQSDGTPGGTNMIADINPSGDSGLFAPAALGTDVFFPSTDGGNTPPDVGSELWKTSAPYTSAALVKNINADGDGTESSYPNYLTSFNGSMFFSARGGEGASSAADLGEELWKTDGTAAGTVLVKNINAGAFSDSTPQAFMVLGNTLLFRADDGLNGAELWKSDGTTAGTQMVTDIYPGDDGNVPVMPHASAPTPQIVFAGQLYFTAMEAAHGMELWKTDGSAAGTQLVKDIRPGAPSAFVNTDSSCFAVVGGELFFLARDDSHDSELWKTDGTEAGTVLLKDINPSGSSSACSFVEKDGLAYFLANDGDGLEIWQTDGTPAGTFSITDMNSAGGLLYQLYLLNGKLYTFWNDSVHGEEMWQAIPPQVTTTTISADVPAISSPNQAVAVSVTVSGPLSTPTGTVDISGATSNCQVTLSAGAGSCNVVFSASGSQTLTASYSGDATSLASSDTETHFVTTSASFTSTGAQDGWLLEAGETSNSAGTLNAGATTFQLGDNAANKQFRAILHFNTAGLPDTAQVTKATLKLRQAGPIVGTKPFNTHGGLRADIRKPFFGTSATLQLADFQVPAGASTVATFGATPVSSWFSAILNTPGRGNINRIGTTQFRLRFATDDNNDLGADFIKFYSGNFGTAANRPTLVVEYYVP